MRSIMARYLKNFVTGHGINFERNKNNVEAYEKSIIEWKKIRSNLDINHKSIIMLCGAKNNGKSSLLRHLVNSYNHPENEKGSTHVGSETDSLREIDNESDGGAILSERYAYLIDCDPGQPELTSPGMVSGFIIRASAPLLQSPSYMNVLQHEPIIKSSVGGTNMSVNPRMYIDNCRNVINQVKEHRERQDFKQPIFINTMGHIRNVGLAMLMDLIKICRPTNLIVLNVETDPMRTIYADLSPSTMDNTPASFYYESTSQRQKKLKYKYDIYNLPFTFVDSSSIAAKNRTALQLAYMSSLPDALYKPIMQSNTKWLSLDSVSIYCVSSYPLALEIILELLFHSWVHLVKLRGNPLETGNEPQVCRIIHNVSENTLYGCGIVTDIDFEKKRMAIITPVDQDTMNELVNCVIKPLSIQVPREILQASG